MKPISAAMTMPTMLVAVVAVAVVDLAVTIVKIWTMIATMMIDIVENTRDIRSSIRNVNPSAGSSSKENRKNSRSANQSGSNLIVGIEGIPETVEKIAAKIGEIEIERSVKLSVLSLRKET